MTRVSPRRALLDGALAVRLRELEAMRSPIIDIGGERRRYRGNTHLPGSRFVVNIDPRTGPDVVADAVALPIRSSVVRSVYCMEVLEHVRDERAVASEITRILCVGGECTVSVPFLFHVHADPDDYRRFTAHGLCQTFSALEPLRVERQGTWVSVVSQLCLDRASVRRSALADRICRVGLRLLSGVLMRIDQRSTRGRSGLDAYLGLFAVLRKPPSCT